MFICDYLLWYFNTHDHFEYIDYMGLNEPEENCNMMLAKVRIFFSDFGYWNLNYNGTQSYIKISYA